MRLDRFLAKSRIIDIESRDLRGALEELVLVSTYRSSEEFDRNAILNALMERENAMTTYLGHGVALPHLRLKMAKRPYIFAVGRCPDGLEHDGSTEYRHVRILFLLLAAEDDRNYLNVLASLARLFRERPLVQNILEAPELKGFQERVFLAFGGLLAKPERSQNRLNRLFLKQAERIAKTSKSAALVVFSDTFAGGIEITDSFPDFRTVLVTRAATERYRGHKKIDATIEVRSFSKERLSQLRSAILIGLTRGTFNYNDRLTCVGGLPASNQMDTVLVVEVEREFQSVLSRDTELLPSNLSIEVIERILAIATELSVEGREGRPVGAMFVLGDTDRVNTMVKPLILNPFFGYPEEDRNVLNPFMDETIKELSSIDGAFIIRGSGVIESAGTLIHAPAEFYRDMPSGLGSRHAAAAAISQASDSVAIVVSASNGQISLFRRGVMLPLLDRSVAIAL